MPGSIHTTRVACSELFEPGAANRARRTGHGESSNDRSSDAESSDAESSDGWSHDGDVNAADQPALLEKRSRRRASTCMWILQTRDSDRESSSPISRMARFSQ